MGRRGGWVVVVALGCLVDNPLWDPDGAASGSVGSGAVPTTGGGATLDPESSSSGAESGPGAETEPVTTGVDNPRPPLPAAGCGPLPDAAEPTVQVGPEDAETLQALLDAAEPGTTFLLTDGDYAVPSAGAVQLIVNVDATTIRSASGDRVRVRLLGAEGADAIRVEADNVRIAELTISGAGAAGVRVAPGDVDLMGTEVYRVNVIDAAGNAYQASGTAGGYASDGVVACSAFEVSSELRGQQCEFGGLRLEGVHRFVVRDNAFRGFYCPDPAATPSPAMRVLDGARDVDVTGNEVRNAYRGIVLGQTPTTAADREWDDNPCGTDPELYWGLIGGTVANNTVWIGLEPPPPDSALAGWAICGTDIVHNTVVSLQPPFHSIEHRYAHSTGRVTNNLVSHTVTPRDGSSITPENNITGVTLDVFVDAMSGDLHLVDGATPIDAGAAFDNPLVSVDIDGDDRDARPDVGADEFSP